MPTIVTTNFAPGMRRDYAFAGGVPGLMEEIVNFDVDRHGRLVRRGGSTNATNSAATNPYCFIQRVEVSHHSQATSSPTVYLPVVEISAAPLRKLNAATGALGLEMKNYSVSAGGSSFSIGNYRGLRPAMLTFGPRLLIGMGTYGISGLAWSDYDDMAAGRAYTLGASAPASITTAVNSSGTGTNLENNEYYNVGYTYYQSEYGIETKLKTTTQQATNDTIRLTMTQTIDEGFNQYRFYRSSTSAASALLAAAIDVQFIAAAAKTDGISVDYVDFDATTYGFNTDGGPTDTAYTLGALNDTDDHDQFTGRADFMATEDGVVYIGEHPRTIYFTKRTSDTYYPDWVPTENQIEIGSSSSKMTGVVRHPLGQGVLVFTQDEVIRVTGTSINDIQQQTVLAMGCPYPRTIVQDGQDIYFLNDRNNVVRYSGGGVEVLSNPVDEEFDDLRWDLEYMPCAGLDRDRYYIAYNKSGKHSTSSGTLTVDHEPGAVFMGGSFPDGRATSLTDGTAWDLSGVSIGDWVIDPKEPDVKHGIVVSVNDGTDTVIIEGHVTGWYPSDTVEVYRNDRVALYNLEYKTWAIYEGLALSDFAFLPDRGGALYATQYGSGHIKEINTTDSTDAGSVAITSTVSSPWRAPQPGGKYVKLESLQIMMIGGAETALTITTYLDGDTTGTAATARTPGPSNVHEIAFDDQVGFQYRYQISGVAAGTIIRIVENWEAI